MNDKENWIEGRELFILRGTNFVSLINLNKFDVKPMLLLLRFKEDMPSDLLFIDRNKTSRKSYVVIEF